ncbi:unnamed protein product [Hermetia illucens]|uniref:Receptor ligand binding region domain-containing protein n=1 Tax=Hermetia illucens TaxID=343691 RepID=A0A7R8UDX3_HERIL|nr:unnamed protein product [Hermetia illucens]
MAIVASWRTWILVMCCLYPTSIVSTSRKPNHKTSWNSSTRGDITIGFLAGYSHMKVVLGALPLALEAINRNPNILPNHRLRFKARDIGVREGDYRAQPIKFMTQMRDDDVIAFLGPDEGCTSEALVAAAWNMPMISYKCTDTAVSNKSVFHSFARTLAPASKVSKSVIALLTAFDWRKFSIIAGGRPEWGSEVAQAIRALALTENLTVMNYREISDYIPIQSTLQNMQKIVDETYETTRIYVFVGEHIAMVDFVRCLQNRRLLETGDYIVISVDDEIYDPTRRLNIMERVSSTAIKICMGWEKVEWEPLSCLEIL